MRILLLIVLVTVLPQSGWSASVARLWNEQNLAAIRIDFPHPPLHARNLFHVSLAMWDAWAAYDADAVGCVFFEKSTAEDVGAAREEALSYAAYRVLSARYASSRGADITLPAVRQQLTALGYDPDFAGTEGDAPAAVGNRVAEAVLAFELGDGSREGLLYSDFTYQPANEPLILQFGGTSLLDPNRWQPLAFEVAFTQNGLVASKVQSFLGSHWGEVRPFGLRLKPGEVLYHDPGMPPQLGGEGDAEYKAGNVEVIWRSSLLDPDNGEMIDISPGAYGNNSLGENDGTGHALNPVTGEPYDANVVKHGDFARVLAEFWADGPDSETPPGHWNVLVNEISEHPSFHRRWGGEGPELDPLEWDIKTYFVLNAATHDAAIAAWGCKRRYDYVRPISSIRYLASLGQSSDPDGPSYNPAGIPLVDGLIEVVTEETTSSGGRHAHFAGLEGEIAILAWAGEPEDAATQYSGVAWILAENWFPYQRSTFVTPAFAGYVSGHSAFSRAAAEVLTRITGSPYFPGGKGSFRAPKDAFLHFEKGPSTDVVLEWGTYYDAADQAGISRLYGGIHVPIDDGPGRVMGAVCGVEAWKRAEKYFSGSILQEAFPVDFQMAGTTGDLRLTWEAIPGFYYWVETSDDAKAFYPYTLPARAESVRGEAVVTEFVRDDIDRAFVRVMRSIAP